MLFSENPSPQVQNLNLRCFSFCSTHEVEKNIFFSSDFCSNALLEIHRFPGSKWSSRNLYFRRRWLYRFSIFSDVTDNQNFFLLFDRSEKEKKNFMKRGSATEIDSSRNRVLYSELTVNHRFVDSPTAASVCLSIVE